MRNLVQELTVPIRAADLLTERLLDGSRRAGRLQPVRSTLAPHKLQIWDEGVNDEMCGRGKKHAFAEDQASAVDRRHLSNLMFYRQNPELRQ